MRTITSSFLVCATSLVSAIAHANYRDAVLADGPSAYYRLGELSGATAADSSGNGHDGTYIYVHQEQPGAIQTEPSNSAAVFNGTNSLVDTNYSYTGNQFTIEAWVRPIQAKGVQQLVVGISGGMALIYNAYANPGLAAVSFFNGSAFRLGYSTSALPLKSWTYLAGVWDGTQGNLYLYVNGILDRVVRYAGESSKVVSPSPYLQIGAFDHSLHSANTYKAQFFEGSLDEIAYYEGALTAEDISAHFAAATVPEPASFALLTGGLGALCFSWRKTRASHAPSPHYLSRKLPQLSPSSRARRACRPSRPVV